MVAKLSLRKVATNWFASNSHDKKFFVDFFQKTSNTFESVFEVVLVNKLPKTFGIYFTGNNSHSPDCYYCAYTNIFGATPYEQSLYCDFCFCTMRKRFMNHRDDDVDICRKCYSSYPVVQGLVEKYHFRNCEND